VQLTGLAEPWSRLLVTRNMQIDAYGARWRSDPRLRLDSPMRLCFEQVASLMQGIAIPSLLITGEQGFPGLVQSLPQARAWYSELQVVQLQGDHHLHMENADEVAQTLAGFLQGRKSNPGD
jgi:pimeloyl-ACP methyl ester carboxylesterase